MKKEVATARSNLQEQINTNIVKRMEKLKKWSDIEFCYSEYEKCKNDILYFFEWYLWTENKLPWLDKTAENIPFLPFDYQKEFIVDMWKCIKEGQLHPSERSWPTNIFVEKSRQMWVTWCVVGVFVYGYIFHKHDYLIISKDEQEAKTNLWRVREMMEALPAWMLPPWFSKKKGTPHNQELQVSRDDWHWSIQGASASPNAWRGSTKHAIFLDEMAFMVNGRLINTSCSSATQCRIMNSTPNGKGNIYYEMREKAISGKIRWYRFHWTENPLYDEAWYNEQKKNRTPVDISQELEIDYEGSLEGRVYPEWKEGVVEFWDFVYDSKHQVYFSIDNARWGNDPNAIVVFQLIHKKIRIIDSHLIWWWPSEVSSFVACRPITGMKLNDKDLQFLDRLKMYYNPIVIADPYDSNAAMNGTTISKEYARYWIHVQLPTVQKWQYGNVYEQIRIVSMMLPRFQVDSLLGKDASDAMYNSHYPKSWDWSNRITPQTKPVHDQWSHCRTAIEYFALYLYEKENKESKNLERKRNTNPKYFRDYVTWELHWQNSNYSY